MSLDEGKWKQYVEMYPEATECTYQSDSMTDALPRFEYLRDLRPTIPKELYAVQLRKLLKMDTTNVPSELRLEMLAGVDPEDIMFQDELDAINNEFDDYIIVYRGTSKSEDVPGICWTIKKYVAEDTFYDGRLFEARIPKTSILAYFAHDVDEGEVIAHVTSGYKIIKED